MPTCGADPLSLLSLSSTSPLPCNGALLNCAWLGKAKRHYIGDRRCSSIESRQWSLTLLALVVVVTPGIVRDTDAGIVHGLLVGNGHEDRSRLLGIVQWGKSSTGLWVCDSDTQHLRLHIEITLISHSAASQLDLDVLGRSRHTTGVTVPVPAVARIVKDMAIGKVTVGGVAEEAVVSEFVVDNLVAEAGEVADWPKLHPAATRAGILGGWRFRVGQIVDEDAPEPLVTDLIVDQGVVLPTCKFDAGSHRC